MGVKVERPGLVGSAIRFAEKSSDGRCRELAGNITGLMATHAIRHQEQPVFREDAETILVDLS